MRPARQRRLRQTHLREDGTHGGDVEGFAAVRCGAQRQFFAAQLKPIDAAAFDERQHLEHLDRGSNEAVMRRVAGAGSQALPGMRNRHVHAMRRFDDSAPQYLDDAFTGRH